MHSIFILLNISQITTKLAILIFFNFQRNYLNFSRKKVHFWEGYNEKKLARIVLINDFYTKDELYFY